MDRRRIFTVDPQYFPLNRMREIVDYLHSHDQHFGMSSHTDILEGQPDAMTVLMTDPAVAYLPNGGYGPFDRGSQKGVWLKAANGSDSLGAVWPGTLDLN